jgi:hypothetical protein
VRRIAMKHERESASAKGKKVRSLSAKSLTGKQSRTVKGGVIAIISSPKPVQTEYLPYIEQKGRKP